MAIRDRIKSLRRVRAGDLKPSPHNWRTHPDEQRKALEGILAEVGIADACIARQLPDGSLELIDGHLRADLDPDQKMPVLVLDVDEAEAKKLLATLDPLAALAEADAAKLDALLREVDTGSEAVLEMLADLAAEAGVVPPDAEPVDAEPQIDRAAELQKEWGTKAGQVWEVQGKAGTHRVMCGDSTKTEDVGRLMAGAKAGLCFTSPPYLDQRKYNGCDVALDALLGFIDLASGFCRLLVWNLGLARTDGEINPYWDSYTARAKACGLKMVGWLVWDRGAPCSIGQQTAMFPIEHEFLFAFSREPFKLIPTVPNATAGQRCTARIRGADGKLGAVREMVKRDARELGTVIVARPVASNADHPAQYPIDLPMGFIASVDGSVYDPFLGSGTTLIAAENLGRVCYGMEISPAYVAVILQRAKDAGMVAKLVD